MSAFTLRRASADDCRALFEMANDPLVRSMAYSTAPIPWEGHCRWLERKLADAACRIYVAVDAAGAVLGQVRFDVVGADTAEVDVHAHPQQRGRGLGAALIAQGSAAAFDELPVDRLLAVVKPGNERSVKAFERAGYVLDAERNADGSARLWLRR
jgi:UDP-2,4-diacetamido-2,4,6-trideoxy-beta-L-altropyranose hydrolase